MQIKWGLMYFISARCRPRAVSPASAIFISSSLLVGFAPLLFLASEGQGVWAVKSNLFRREKHDLQLKYLCNQPKALHLLLFNHGGRRTREKVKEDKGTEATENRSLISVFLFRSWKCLYRRFHSFPFLNLIFTTDDWFHEFFSFFPKNKTHWVQVLLILVQFVPPVSQSVQLLLLLPVNDWLSYTQN